MSLNYKILGIMIIQEGISVKATGRIAQIPVSEAYLGPFINAIAKPIDGRASKSRLGNPH